MGETERGSKRADLLLHLEQGVVRGLDVWDFRLEPGLAL